MDIESIREIVSVSHDGFGHMWYPFSASFEESFTIISAEYYFEIGDLLTLISSMFATNNHSPEIFSKQNARMTKKHLTGNEKKTQCSIRFITDKNEYLLQRCFIGPYSTEARLQKIGSNVVYRNNDVIDLLSKFSKPVIIEEGSLFNNNSLIFKPLDNHTRKSLVALSNKWARMIGFVDSRLEIDYEGRWSTRGEVNAFGNRMYSARNNTPSPLRLLTNLAQTVMKKRMFGLCTPIFSPFNADYLNDFETITIMQLVKDVCQEESLQFIIGSNTSSNTNSMINAIKTPRLSIYET